MIPFNPTELLLFREEFKYKYFSPINMLVRFIGNK